ncbi:MAG: hypothetical protein L0229_09365 [Blastocatellia bacterium]|nr:hypothetical protein [Blastocatellia bacterium]
MKRLLILSVLLAFMLTNGVAQQPGTVKVNPTGVNINTSGATVAFLTFGGLVGKRPAEATWCGELIPAAPDIGFKCNPATIFGQLPARFDQSTLSGNTAFTDIMSIPPSVARRAYQAAQDGQESAFFYVRRFISLTGGPDEFVAVTCRLTGGGARTPFALTDVKLSFTPDKPVLFVKPGEKLTRIKAEIAYNGTGRLKGRWEVVLPGEEAPSVRDLLTEATLPIEERGLQRRYTQISRFNVFLPPVGKYTLTGPDPSRLPSTVEGQYLVLLRIEASDDKEGDSSLAAVGAGAGVVHGGAVAGFPLPPLRYYVGSGSARPSAQPESGMAQLLPNDNFVADRNKPLDFTWSGTEEGRFYRLEIVDQQQNMVLSALLPSGIGTYRAPSWLKDKAGDRSLRWRVVALDQVGITIAETPWRTLRYKKQ